MQVRDDRHAGGQAQDRPHGRTAGVLVDERRSGRGQGAREAERAARVGQAGEGDEAGPGASAAQIVDQRAVALEEPGREGVAGRV